MRQGVIFVVVLAIAGCPAPSDTTPLIHVDPNAAARAMRLMPGHVDPGGTRGGGGGPATPPAPARVHVMKAGEELAGPNVIGRPGDLVLENDQVVFVIDQLGSSYGFAESGGNLVDAADARARI